MNESVNYVGVCRTAPATPGLLMSCRPVAGIGEASLLGALAEIFGVNFFLSVIGLELVPVHKISKKVGCRFSFDVL